MAAPVPGTQAWYQSRATPVYRPPAPKPAPAWQGLNTQLQGVFNNPQGEQNAIKYGWSSGLANDSAYRGGAGAGGPVGPSGRWITPDYSGILGSFTADARARFGAGLESMKAQRLSGAKGAVNRLGIRDVPGMLEKLQAYGLSQADLQGAADNPWSELKALDQTAKDRWGNSVSSLASQGGYRSGATINARQTIDQGKAREEARLTQETLDSLSQGLWGEKEWERQQRDQMEQSIASQQAALASAYQPYWQQD